MRTAGIVNSTIKKVLFFISILLSAGMLLVSAAGCAQQTAPTQTPTPTPTQTPTQTATGGDYLISVYLDDTLVYDASLDELESIQQVSITADGKKQEGPRLLDVLKLAGIENFEAVTVIGKNQARDAAAELELSRDQVTDTVVLDITNQGTTKLAGTDIPSSSWVFDVEALRAAQ